MCENVRGIVVPFEGKGWHGSHQELDVGKPSVERHEVLDSGCARFTVQQFERHEV